MTKTMSSIIEEDCYHCVTQLKEKTFCCTWSFDFYKIYNYDVDLKYIITEHNFVLSICPDKDKLKFYSLVSQTWPSYKRCIFSISLKSYYDGKFCEKINGKCKISKNDSILLYELPISYISNNHSKYLLNGTLTIYFKFHILLELINNSINYSYKPPAMTDTDSFVSNEISNPFVTFVVNKEQTLQANKSLLCSKSKVFKTMFDCGLKESKTNEIEITDIKYDILKELLFFVQTDYLSRMPEDIGIDAICELFIAADKYDIKDLKLICEQYIIKNTTKENVVEYLKFAYLNNATVLTKYAKDFIKLYSKDIVNTPNFITLMQEYPELLIQIQDIELSMTCNFYDNIIHTFPGDDEIYEDDE